MRKLASSFYLQDTLTVAQKLLNCRLVHCINGKKIVGRIMETEAYIGPIDKACHAYQFKRTQRTEPLFLAGGSAYVYFVYGMYHCMNVVTEGKDIPCAVLIRSIEILEGLKLASSLRYQLPYSSLSSKQRKNLADGPGKLCIAMGIDRKLNRENLSGNRLFILPPKESSTEFVISQSKRIGIDYAEEAKDFLWRFSLVKINDQ